MPHFFIYLLKVNIALMLFYIVYRFVLRRLTFYRANRFYLLFSIFCSSLFPLVQFTIDDPADDTGELLRYVPNWNEAVSVIARPGISRNPWDVLYIIYWLGALVMLSFLVISCISLFRVWRSSEKIEENGIRLRITKKKISPFTFWNTIFINPQEHPAAELQTIIRHERVHVRQWHSADILLGEINKIFYWFNPGAWLVKNAIRENLEFIADEQVLNNGEDRINYQYTLLHTMAGMPVANGITSRFSFIHLKNRISMMNKKRTAAAHYMRYLLLLPLLAVMAIVFVQAQKTKPVAAPAKKAVAGTPVKETVPAAKTGNKQNQIFVLKHKGEIFLCVMGHGEVIKINWTTATEEEKKQWQEKYGEFPAPKSAKPATVPKPPAPPPSTGKTGNTAKQSIATVDSMPRFNGSFRKFLEQNLQYPEAAMEKNIQGEVIIGFTVDKKGRLYNMNVAKQSPCKDKLLTAEAMRILKLSSGSWLPAQSNDIAVNSYHEHHITFVLASE